jgi:hypothetical protein
MEIIAAPRYMGTTTTTTAAATTTNNNNKLYLIRTIHPYHPVLLNGALYEQL